MLRSPAIKVSGATLHLPVAAGAGATLAAELLAQPFNIDAFVALLKSEPALLAWGALQLDGESAAIEEIAVHLPELIRRSPQPWTAVAQGENAVAWQAFRRQGKKFGGNIAGLVAHLRSSAKSLAESKSDLKRGAKTADDVAIGLARVLNSLRTVQARLNDASSGPQPNTIATEPSQLESAKQQALYHFAYGLSHEINNPLANISLRAQSLQADESHPEKRRKLAVIQAQANRAYEMIASLMLYARPPALKIGAISLDSMLEALRQEWQRAAHEQGTQIELELITGTYVQGDEIQLRHAFRSLLQNALEAVQSGGRVVISAKAAGDQVVVSLWDSGPGISAEHLPHIFDPYFSGREAGRGLGLGLSQCWRIVQLHGGRIEVQPENSGAAIVVYLPLSAVPE